MSSLVKKLGLTSKSQKSPRKEPEEVFKTKTTEIMCDECSKFYASNHCPICETNQCFECRNILHSVPRRKHHLDNLLPPKIKKIVLTEEKPTTKVDLNYCIVHQEKQLIYFCTECYKPVCPDCATTGYHKTHNTLSTEEATLFLVEKIKTSEIHHIDEIQRVKGELIELEKDLEENLKKTTLQIENYFQDARTIINAHEKKILDDLAFVHQTSGFTLQKLIEKHESMSNTPEKKLKTLSEYSFLELWEIQKNLLEMENYKSEISTKDKICSSYDFSPDKLALNPLLETKLDKGEPYTLKKKNPGNIDINGTILSGEGIKSCLLQKEANFDIQFVDFEGKSLKVPNESLEITITGPEKLIITPKIKLIKNKFNVKYTCTRVGDIELIIKLSSEIVRSISVVCESTNVIVLQYESPFDKNGLFSHLGLNKKKFENPVILRLVTIESDTLSSFGSKPFTLAGDACTNFYTDAKDPNQEVSVLISILPSEHQLRPNYYCLRNALKVVDNPMRNWKLEGSTGSGQDWKLLKEHVNDTTIEEKSGFSAAWPIETDEYFSLFKLTSTGEQADGDQNVTLGGIEFYGVLKKIK
eukprot:gene12394-6061_t